MLEQQNDYFARAAVHVMLQSYRYNKFYFLGTNF